MQSLLRLNHMANDNIKECQPLGGFVFPHNRVSHQKPKVALRWGRAPARPRLTTTNPGMFASLGLHHNGRAGARPHRNASTATAPLLHRAPTIQVAD